MKKNSTLLDLKSQERKIRKNLIIVCDKNYWLNKRKQLISNLINISTEISADETLNKNISNFNDGRIYISISKQEIVDKDISRIRGIFDRYITNLKDLSRNNFTIQVTGYNDNHSELFLINEVRAWFHKFFDYVPELFYWISCEEIPLKYYALMFCNPIRVNGGTVVDTEDYQRFLIWGYQNLNIFFQFYLGE